ncbi:thioredoxin fold domain-containing protein [Flagellimonas myxillae]|uniref:thioredoxin fold domain-containing protein n=1 Tax=Flagellimonas myxillae TaxID=2942214 RepID=UPI00201EBB69|nr:thioredoxin fold domain-containing protein [Muricauda myxillae]MCL6265728.1 thioredoxin fold domain-containing protein [Muricauda myxillae]
MSTSRLFPFGFVLVLLLSLSFSPRETEAKEHKLILFEGSDWCVNCIRLEKNVLTKAVFVNFMEQNNISIERIDFPQRKQLDQATQQYNAKMAEKYGFKGVFPTIILTSSDSEELQMLEYLDQSCEDFMDQIAANLKE